ncbi:FAD/NAD(P)-binding protein [Streptomyces sp. NPDC001393]
MNSISNLPGDGERRTPGDGPLRIAIVGAGPRGLSVLERLCAYARRSSGRRPVTVHVIDPAPAGAGQVWRTDQSRHLLMNTVASQITVYTDDSVRVAGPVEPGPSLHEWATSLALLGEAGDYPPETLAEARRLGPDSYPTRAFYGHYLRDCFRRAVAGAPAQVTVRVHRSRAVALADTHGVADGPQGLRLQDGTRLDDLDAVVLCQGHVPARPTPAEARTASLARIHHLTYLPPANPADLDLSALAPGQNVLLRGLGLNFFDHMALLTAGRGGTFTRHGDRLVYEPSGREPRLYAFSRRGVPYHARGENEKGATGRYHPRLLTPEFIADLRARSAARGDAVHLRRDLWPLISREVESVYYGTLLTARGRDAERAAFTDAFLALPLDGDPAELLDAYGIEAADRWDWEALADPCGGRTFGDRAAFHDWLLGHLAADVAAARAGNLSGPLKAALDILRDLRNEVRLAVDHSGLDGTSHRDDLDRWYTPLNAFLSIGPPVSRIEEMAALIEAGVLTVLGPRTRVRLEASGDGGGPSGAGAAFVAESSAVPGPPVRAGALIEARLPEADLLRTADPLLRHLLDTEQATAHRVGSPAGDYTTGGLAVTARPSRLVDARGRIHPRRYAYGIPTEAVHWATASGIRPGVDSVTLGDSDAIARAILSLQPATTPHAPAGHRTAADTLEVIV